MTLSSIALRFCYNRPIMTEQSGDGEKKKCAKCGLEKDLNDFYVSKVYKDGRRSICKDCDFERNKQYRLAHGMKPRSESAKAKAESDGIRTCIACGQSLPIGEFSSHSSRCRACRRLYKEKKRREQGILPRGYIQKEAIRTGRIRCTVCNKDKPLEEYDKNGPVYRTQCKECRKSYLALWYKANKDTVVADYREANREAIKAKAKQYSIDHSDELKEYRKKRYAEHRERLLLATKKWREANPERRRAYMLEWQKNNFEHRKEYKRKYRKENADAIRKYTQSRRNFLYKTDPLYKLKVASRNLILKSFKRRGFSKKSHTAKILGCTWEQLQDHLFETWKTNYGTDWNGEPYHIDHIVPLATASTEQEVVDLCHYTNLQLLTPEDNLAKNDSLEWQLSDK